MESTSRPLIFVAMPFGRKRDARTNLEIDFDAIYRDGIQPAVAGLKVDLIRADEERSGGIVHLPMFERLLIAEIAIVDVTIENANVFYELGVRHAARPRATIITRARGAQMPFDIKLIRAVTYELKDGVLTEEAAKTFNAVLAERIGDALRDFSPGGDSPLFQLIPAFTERPLPHEAAESFRDRAKKVNDLRDRLLAARRIDKVRSIPAISAIESELGDITSANAESTMDVVLSYRDVEAWPEMISLIERLPAGLAEGNQTIREQYALALNRRALGNDRQKALDILVKIVSERGDSPETCSIIGRIYKDYYREASERGERGAAGNLETAIDWYRRGFNADPRDAYPGINLATLLALEGSPESIVELRRVAAALSFALARLNAISSRDYWTLATVIEAAVLDNDWKMVDRSLGRLLTVEPTLMQLQTTRNNLQLILNAKPPHIDSAELERVVADFSAAIGKLEPPPV